MGTGGRGVGVLVARGNDHGDFFDAGAGDFLGENGERGFGCAVAIDEGLEREGALVFSGGGDDGFRDFHGADSVRPKCEGKRLFQTIPTLT